MLLTTNTLQKTFLIKQGNHTGTAFAVEVEGKQYLATAKHVVPDPSEQPKVMHAETWKDLPFNSIFHHPGEPDIAVITLNQQIAPSHPVELSSAGISLGQNMIILGFPFGWNYTQYDINNGYPMPFVKSATFSALLHKKELTTIILDGHSNPGFSGGPIVAEGKSQMEPKVIGVVTESNIESTSHPNQFNPPLKNMNGFPVPDDRVHPTNAGFIRAHEIKHVIEVIEAHPYGTKMAP